MKTLCLLSLVCLLALTVMPGLAREYTPSEIDLTDVKEVNGRLIGQVMLEKISSIPLQIDCPVPSGFTKEQNRTYTVRYKTINDEMLKSALEGLGHDTSEGRINTLDDYAAFTLNKSSSPIYEIAYIRGQLYRVKDLAGSADADLPLFHAKERIKAIVEKLGGTVHEELLHAAHFTQESAYLYTTTDSSVGDKLKNLAVKRFLQNREKRGLTGEDISMVTGVLELNGLPFVYQLPYLDDKNELTGSRTNHCSATFLNDGTLVNFHLSGIPQVQTDADAQVPDRSWEALLRLWIANFYTPWSNENEVSIDPVFGEVEIYATYDILTGFYPCYLGDEKESIVPGYYTIVENRVIKDNTVTFAHTDYLNAITMEKKFDD